MTLLFLSASAAICLPRQFQVTVVENSDESHLATASWLFPLYMLLMSLFVLPLAAVGGAALPEGSNPDLFMLLLPLHFGRESLATFIFIGGLSAATSMVIVSTIALSTMISNHIVAPLALRVLAAQGVERSGDVKRMLLATRRVAMVLILGLGYIYFRASGRSDALAATGLIAFCGVAQFLPALIAGIFWRNATKRRRHRRDGRRLRPLGLYPLPAELRRRLPALAPTPSPMASSASPRCAPRRSSAATAADALVHATAWSLGANTAVLIAVSLCTRLTPMERLQGTLFVGAFRSDPFETLGIVRRSAPRAELYVLAQRILGTDPASALFQDAARAQGRLTGLPDPTPAFISRLERELAGSVGAASAHAMVGRIAEGEVDLARRADRDRRRERAPHAHHRGAPGHERRGREERRPAPRRQRAAAGARRPEGRVPEPRQPRAQDADDLGALLRRDPARHPRPAPAERARFAGIIQSESLRLTRLIDQIHELSFPEERDRAAPPEPVDPEEVLDTAVEIALAPFADRRVALTRPRRARGARVRIDPGKLAQVYINLIANAVLHSDMPQVEIAVVELPCRSPAATWWRSPTTVRAFPRRCASGSSSRSSAAPGPAPPASASRSRRGSSRASAAASRPSAARAAAPASACSSRPVR